MRWITGVRISVCRVLYHLASCGHDAVVVAPAPGPDSYAGFPVRLVPGAALPFYPSFVVGMPSRKGEDVLRDFAPHVVHLASPMVLGPSGAAPAPRLPIPPPPAFQTA